METPTVSTHYCWTFPQEKGLTSVFMCISLYKMLKSSLCEKPSTLSLSGCSADEAALGINKISAPS